MDTGPLTPPSPGCAELLANEGLDPEKPDLDLLLSWAADAYNAFLDVAAVDLGEDGLLA
ncbi:hypothetical protein [Streptomyces sp. NPDC001933]|uniref:hypothetical protein n=1 Tax=Streptomyces sp. NPDC001933 TaxID=3364626 RepID=UPI0036A536F8